MDAGKRGAWVRNRPFYRALGKRINALRTERELSQRDVAESVGVSQQALFGYEIGDRRVPTCLLPALARTFHVSLESLLGIAPLPPVRPTRVSPAQQRHVEQLHKLENRDRFAVMRITEALGRLKK